MICPVLCLLAILPIIFGPGFSNLGYFIAYEYSPVKCPADTPTSPRYSDNGLVTSNSKPLNDSFASTAWDPDGCIRVCLPTVETTALTRRTAGSNGQRAEVGVHANAQLAVGDVQGTPAAGCAAGYHSTRYCGVVQAKYGGRSGNALLQYMVARYTAEQLGFGLRAEGIKGFGSLAPDVRDLCPARLRWPWRWAMPGVKQIIRDGSEEERRGIEDFNGAVLKDRRSRVIVSDWYYEKADLMVAAIAHAGTKRSVTTAAAAGSTTRTDAHSGAGRSSSTNPQTRRQPQSSSWTALNPWLPSGLVTAYRDIETVMEEVMALGESAPRTDAAASSSGAAAAPGGVASAGGEHAPAPPSAPASVSAYLQGYTPKQGYRGPDPAVFAPAKGSSSSGTRQGQRQGEAEGAADASGNGGSGNGGNDDSGVLSSAWDRTIVLHVRVGDVGVWTWRRSYVERLRGVQRRVPNDAADESGDATVTNAGAGAAPTGPSVTSSSSSSAEARTSEPATSFRDAASQLDPLILERLTSAIHPGPHPLPDDTGGFPWYSPSRWALAAFDSVHNDDGWLHWMASNGKGGDEHGWGRRESDEGGLRLKDMAWSAVELRCYESLWCCCCGQCSRSSGRLKRLAPLSVMSIHHRIALVAHLNLRLSVFPSRAFLSLTSSPLSQSSPTAALDLLPPPAPPPHATTYPINHHHTSTSCRAAVFPRGRCRHQPARHPAPLILQHAAGT